MANIFESLKLLMQVLVGRATGQSAKRPMRVLLRNDIQNGFMPADPTIAGTGELPVAGAPEIVPRVNKLSADEFFDLLVDIQDWHPPDHGSFYTMHPGKKPFEKIMLYGLEQVLWTPHCRQNTAGAQFYPTLDRSRVARTFQKGTDKTVDSYSGFWDNGRRKSTGLADYLRAEAAARGFAGVEVYVVGVTRPFCPSYTAKDSVDEGFKTYLIEDACSMLGDSAAEKCDRQTLEKHGVTFITSRDIPRNA